jgi:hypothetical protein
MRFWGLFVNLSVVPGLPQSISRSLSLKEIFHKALLPSCDLSQPPR